MNCAVFRFILSLSLNSTGDNHVKSKDYSDRDKKGKAYESLVEKFKEIHVNANREKVIKK